MENALVAVVGNIATGKSTLVTGLASLWRLPFELEAWEANPFLAATQHEPERYAVAAETWFVAAAAASQARLGTSPGGILERPVSEHLEVFIPERTAAGQIDERERHALRTIGSALERGIPEPDVHVLLIAPAAELHRRIVARGRSFEQAIALGDLERLNARYATYARRRDAPVLTIDTSEVDLRDDQEIREVARRVEALA